MNQTVLLSIDWGKKVLGFSLKKPGEALPTPLGYWFRHHAWSLDLKRLLCLISHYQVCTIVLGWPGDLHNFFHFRPEDKPWVPLPNPQCDSVFRFYQNLNKGLLAQKQTVDFVLWEECLTTWEAEALSKGQPKFSSQAYHTQLNQPLRQIFQNKGLHWNYDRGRRLSCFKDPALITSAKGNRPTRPPHLDHLAATLLLENFLECHPNWPNI